MFLKESYVIGYMQLLDDASVPWDLAYILLYFFGLALILIVNYFLVFRSDAITKMIVKEDKELALVSKYDKYQILEIALIIIGAYIIVLRFPAFISAVSNLVYGFVNTLDQSKEYIPSGIASVLLYFFGFYLLTNSTQVVKWIKKVNIRNSEFD